MNPFQICNTISLYLVTSWYTGSPEFMHLIAGSLYLWQTSLTSLMPPSPPRQDPWQPPFYSLWVWLFKIPHISENIKYLSDLFHLVQCPQGPSILQRQDFSSFCGWIIFIYLYIQIYIYIYITIIYREIYTFSLYSQSMWTLWSFLCPGHCE